MAQGTCIRGVVEADQKWPLIPPNLLLNSGHVGEKQPEMPKLATPRSITRRYLRKLLIFMEGNLKSRAQEGDKAFSFAPIEPRNLICGSSASSLIYIQNYLSTLSVAQVSRCGRSAASPLLTNCYSLREIP